MNRGLQILRPLLVSLLIGVMFLFLGNILWAMEPVQLKDIKVNPLPNGKVQICLELTAGYALPKSFMLEKPASLVLDFSAVQNCLPKALMNQTLEVGLLKGINVVEAAHKTRVILELKKEAFYDIKQEGHFINIILEEEGNPRKQLGLDKCEPESAINKVESVDFRRGEHGEGRLIVHLSSAKMPVDFQEKNGKVILNFAKATVEPKYERRYEVIDFATPIQYINVVKKGNDVEMVIDAIGDYDKMAYQMDRQFIVEVRGLSREEKCAQKELTGHFTGERISLNFQDIEVRAALQILADFAGFNLITSDAVKGNITLRLQNVPWDQALDIVLKSKNLDKRQTGGIMMVGPMEEIAAREKRDLENSKLSNDLSPLKSELIQVNYAKAEDFANMLKDKANSLMTARGNVTVDKRTNNLLIQDTANKLVEIRALLRKLDIPVRQVEISTQIVIADNSLESSLGVRFGGGANAGWGHRRLGIGSTMDRARGIGDYTDRNPPFQPRMPQSNLDFTQAPPIVSSTGGTTLTNAFSQNANANITQKPLLSSSPGPTVNNTEGLFSDLAAITTTAGATPVGKLSFALARLPNGTLLDLELQALEYESKTKTVARPKLLTMDQNKASVETGVDIPYLQASSSGATNVVYKKASLILEVTPQITPDSKVSMDLQISNDQPGPNIANVGVEVLTQRLQTKVLADDGETIVLGGILKIFESKTVAKIPFFGNLPIIGNLFRNRDTVCHPSELIIFLTPRIVKPLATAE